MINIKNKSKCCGCNACVQRCPKQCMSMREDEEGFLYPFIDTTSCIECGLCEKVCPVISQNEDKKPLKVYAAINPNGNIRKNSSSGGIFSMLAQYILSKEGVVFGAKLNNKQEVVHDYCETQEGLSAFRGSKYVQSRIGNSYKQVETFLKAGRKVLFSGTSCQITGLHKYLRKEYENLLTIDVVCHGVPSPLVWKKYCDEILLKKIGAENALNQQAASDIRISFRDKSDGWKKYNLLVKNENNTLYKECFRENTFMRIFLRNISLRPSCYACPAKSGKSGSDITLADFWGIECYYPQMDDDKGTSLVMLNTEKGFETFMQMKCKIQEATYIQALKHNPSIERSVQEPVLRSFFFKRLRKGDYNQAVELTLRKMRPSIMARVKNKIKYLLAKNKE